MKRSTERAQLALAGSDLGRGELSLDFARNRVDDAASLRGHHLRYGAVLDDMDTHTRQGVRLLLTEAVQHSDPAALDAVDAFLTRQRVAVENLLDATGSRIERDRTRRSLDLLTAARERAGGIRAATECGPTTVTGTDGLGPVPSPCPR